MQESKPPSFLISTQHTNTLSTSSYIAPNIKLSTIPFV
jgi:hypothetical protein